MNGALGFRGRRLLATALARAEAFLLEPVEAVSRPAAIELRPVVAVVGLGPGCGTTTVARALAARLASRDPAGAAAVSGPMRPGPAWLSTGAAGRLARAIGKPRDSRTRTVGRLCIVEGSVPSDLAGAVRHLAPLVLDVGHGEPAGVPVSLADHVLLVASPAVEAALAPVAAASLRRVGPEPIVVLNRCHDGVDLEPWQGRAHAAIASSHAGARLALAGREPRGAMGEAIAELAGASAEPRSAW